MRHWMLMALIGVGGCAVAPATPGGDAPATRATAAAAAPLAGTRWVGVVDASIQSANVPSLELLAEGRRAGYTGCNMMNGTWTAEGGQGRVGGIVATKRMCLGPGADVEKRLMAALTENARLARQGDRLVVTGPSGERFEFAPAR
ncbi:MAG: META domain-containing protein [Betaproteobacteria bacterium]